MSGPSPPQSRAGFEIAIICALQSEADAVEALFDRYWEEEGQQYSKAPRDPNAYTTGVLGGHNVVLARMPSIGSYDGASVAASCASRFTNIKLALVVGICGGVPRDTEGEEIYLGDIIISEGTIQYEIGRQFPNKFIRKDTLMDGFGRPSREIVTLLAKVKGRRGRSRLKAKTLECLPTLLKNLDIKPPDARDDKLFEPTYRHKHQNTSSCKLCSKCETRSDEVCETALRSTCSRLGCSDEKRVRRRLERNTIEPSVYFGLIVSGDKVMKSGEHRDEIASAEKVIAFEMEGSGVFNTFPSVVLKAVCDYSDSHKNKSWQNYAAAAAASCAKAFLEEWVSTDKESSSATPLATTTKMSPESTVPFERDREFIGRDDVLAVVEAKLSQPGSHNRAVLSGLGGVGKSQVAIEYSYRLREKSPQTWVFWVHAGSTAKFEQAYKSIAAKLKLPGWNDPKTDSLRMVSDWLSDVNNGRWLMILDNADDVAVFRPEEDGSSIPQRHIPQVPTGSVLITTRDRAVSSWLTTGHLDIISIDLMTPRDAERLFHSKVPDTESQSSERAVLVEELGYLPLAISQAAAYIVARGSRMSVSKYLEFYRNGDSQGKLLDLDLGDSRRDKDVPNSVTRTLKISLDQIRRTAPRAAEVLSLMAVLDRQNIPELLLRSKNETAFEFEETLAPLQEFSLITVEMGGESFEIHRLVQLATRQWLEQSRQLDGWHEAATKIVADSFPHPKYGNWGVCEMLSPHAREVISYCPVSKEQQRALAQLFFRVAHYDATKGQIDVAIEGIKRCLAIRNEILGAGNRETILTVDALAGLIFQQGGYSEAATLFRRALAGSHKTLGRNDRQSLRISRNLALSLRMQGRLTKAEWLSRQNLVSCERELGPEDEVTLDVESDLTHILTDQGEYELAVQMGRHAFAIYRRKHGLEHPRTVGAMERLAGLLILQDGSNYSEAESLLRSAVASQESIFDAEHPTILLVRGTLAEFLTQLNRHDEAERTARQTLETAESTLGLQHFHKLWHVNILVVLEGKGDDEAAESMYQRAGTDGLTLLGPEHPEVIRWARDYSELKRRRLEKYRYTAS